MGLPVRIPPVALVPVACVCCVLEIRGLCYELITCPEECYRARACTIECDQLQQYLFIPAMCRGQAKQVQCVRVRGQAKQVQCVGIRGQAKQVQCVAIRGQAKQEGKKGLTTKVRNFRKNCRVLAFIPHVILTIM
jgi:hypothetical protein